MSITYYNISAKYIGQLASIYTSMLINQPKHIAKCWILDHVNGEELIEKR